MLAAVGVTVVGPRANPDRHRIVLGDSASGWPRTTAGCGLIRWRRRRSPGTITPPATGCTMYLCCSTSDAGSSGEVRKFISKQIFQQ
jgi:hypothetical protein